MRLSHRDELEIMSIDPRRSLYSLSVLCLLLMAFSCASPAYRTHPEFEMRAKNIETLGIIIPDVKIYELSPGGVIEFRDDWSATGRENVLNAILKGFEEKKYNVKPLTIHEEIEEEMEDLQTLYRVVNRSIERHTYGPQLFPDKKNLDYSLGPIENFLQSAEIDSMILVSGFDQVRADGQRAFVSVAIADSSGAIVWYSGKGSRGGHDLRDPVSTAALVRDILSPLPEASQ